MTLAVGSRLESYEIIATLGAGAMGEVYRARDLRLQRDVAIKILPPAFADDHDRLTRFAREAQMLAAVKHANIAQIYGIVEGSSAAGQPSTRALVMELVEGEDLETRLLRGPVPVDEAIRIAQQIADALDAAHESGIVHRDLKPANIRVDRHGVVKVLDFGLAKRSEPADGLAGASNLPTMHPTVSGMILGTPAYMSPEQARGHPVDRAADVWAWGCVLYEMLSGRTAFSGGTTTDILAAIVSSEPDWSALPRHVPRDVERLLRRCLVKDRRDRLRDAGAVSLTLREPPSEDPRPASRASGWAPLAVAALAVAIAIGSVIVWWRGGSGSIPETRVEVITPPTDDELSLALSPDGRTLVFVASVEGQPRLFLRPLDSSSARLLTGTEGAAYPFWSPDGRSIAFFADNKLKRFDFAGGPVQTLTDTPPGRGGTWNANGVILFAPLDGPIRRIADTGGPSSAVTHVATPLQSNHRFPSFLPDGEHFFFYVRGSPTVQGVYVGAMDGSPSRRLFDADVGPTYLTGGRLFFVRQKTLLSQPFDEKRLEPGGEPATIADGVAVDGTGLGAALSVSASGSMAYRTETGTGRRQLIWFDRTGGEVSRLGESDVNAPLHPELSPDGRRVLVTRTVNGNQDVWLLDSVRGLPTPFTVDAAVDDFAIWAHGGKQILFASNRRGAFDLYLKSLAGDNEELLVSTPSYKSPSDWSRDGRFVLYRMTDPETGYDLWALPVNGDRNPIAVVRTSAEERDGQFSPDGQWIAYQSNESGRFEIYVQSFPGPGGKARISTAGGAQVRWRDDGRELFYVALDGQLMAVPITLDAGAQIAEAGIPLPLFRLRLAGGVARGVNRQQYSVAGDGRRFLINTLTEEETAAPVSLILNWRPPG